MPTNSDFDGFFSTIGDVPIFTYGMITVTALVLSYMTFMDEGILTEEQAAEILGESNPISSLGPIQTGDDATVSMQDISDTADPLGIESSIISDVPNVSDVSNVSNVSDVSNVSNVSNVSDVSDLPNTISGNIPGEQNYQQDSPLQNSSFESLPYESQEQMMSPMEEDDYDERMSSARYSRGGKPKRRKTIRKRNK